MHHVIAPLDPAHAELAGRLSARLAAELALGPRALPALPAHVTVASYTGLGRDRATAAVTTVLATPPIVVRAHGYGVFTGDDDTDLSLHVMVVRTRELDDLHARVCRALVDAGATLGGITRPAVWSPHVTLLDRGLTPRSLAAAIASLADRPHPSWSLTLASLALVRRRGFGDGRLRLLPLDGAGRDHPPVTWATPGAAAGGARAAARVSPARRPGGSAPGVVRGR